MNSETRPQKRTDAETTHRRIRSRHPIPWEWAYYGRHDSVRDGCARFYAERACFESDLRSRPISATEIDVREVAAIFVLYRHPETGEAIERRYEAAVLETDADAVSVTAPPTDGPHSLTERPPRVRYRGLDIPADGQLALPKTVHAGTAYNFRASVTVHPDEQRVLTGP